MQYKALAAALIASLPLFAQAQTNVTLYGIMDAAVAVEDTDVPGEGRRTVINSGNQSSSRLGFRGTEELGNGLKAIFNIEAGVSIDTGAADSALFGRRSIVGLQGSFGQVTVGREYSPIASVAAATDVFGQGFYGSNLSAFTANRLTRRLSNSVNFKSAPMAGFSLLAAYSAGERTVDPSGDLMGVALEYANGPFYAGAGYHRLERLAVEDDKEMAFGAGVKIGDIDLKANYLSADQAGASNKFEQVNLGAAYTMGSNKFFVNLQRNQVETARGDAKGNAWALAYTYALSKRTNVYTTYGSMRNNGLASFGLNSSSTSVTPTTTGATPVTVAGADPSVFTLGVRHSF
ncbi:porin [Massilia sp. Dwa41.01b]|uniref:porin n=1 Tax=unclassified Massilia TaxID=2609279 RepID=UPI001602B95F|nr:MULTISPECIES: porin [unclassified Massilia]QNA88481.1 porin [Massilia sp. Dwa41.01b]QNA99375.1 porin [Massilia sp. Se16.2.3]